MAREYPKVSQMHTVSAIYDSDLFKVIFLRLQTRSKILGTSSLAMPGSKSSSGNYVIQKFISS